MTGVDHTKITSEDYTDLIIQYKNNPQLLEKYKDSTIQIMNEDYAIVYVPASILVSRTTSFRYAELPNLYGLTDERSLEASGVIEVRNIPAFNLRGEGVLIAIIDTGIDYTNPLFIREDGTTKIVSIWDQSIQTGPAPFNTEFGTEYQREQINQALGSETPLDIVPSMDSIGHGTMMAGIAAGNINVQERFSGVAPDAELIIVKLKQAKKPIMDFYMIREESICFQENDLMWGIQYCQYKARDLRKPLVICLGSGTSLDAHDGRTPLCVMASTIANIPNSAMVIPVGNEGNRGRHYFGTIDPSVGSTPVELNVAENEGGFSMVLWGDAPGLFSIDILSPSGEYIPRIPPGIRVNRVLSFIFESTVIFVDYQSVESQTGDQLILLRFKNVSSGIWRFNVYGQGNLAAGFHMWLPMGDFITNDTYFVQPNIYTTILSPSSSYTPMAITAYNPVNGNLYVNSGRGYTRANVTKPELAAPGVNYLGPTLEHTFTSFTGTSVAAAHAAGISAMVLEWGSVRNNQPGISTFGVKNFLIRGADRRHNLTYPNRDWGYGIINIFNSFDILRTSFNV